MAWIYFTNTLCNGVYQFCIISIYQTWIPIYGEHIFKVRTVKIKNAIPKNCAELLFSHFLHFLITLFCTKSSRDENCSQLNHSLLDIIIKLKNCWKSKGLSKFYTIKYITERRYGRNILHCYICFIWIIQARCWFHHFQQVQVVSFISFL